MIGGMTVAETVTPAAKSVLYKPLHELTEDDISQLTREDCRRFLKEKGMRRPSWNKSQAIQQVISLKSLLEPSPLNAAVKASFRPPPITSATTNDALIVNSSSSSSAKEVSHAEMEGSVTALVEDGPNQLEGPFVLDVAREGDYHVDDTQHSRDRCIDAPNLQPDHMTIFYSDKVNVYDGVHVNKQASSFLHLAASRSQFFEDEPRGENLPNLNTPCQLPTLSVKLNLSSPDEPSLQSMQSDVESQTNRQVSLQRYFEKRKDRGKLKMKRKLETSLSGLEIYLSHQMSAPITSINNSKSNTNLSRHLGVPQTSNETKEKHLKSPRLSVDLNDKA